MGVELAVSKPAPGPTNPNQRALRFESAASPMDLPNGNDAEVAPSSPLGAFKVDLNGHWIFDKFIGSIFGEKEIFGISNLARSEFMDVQKDDNWDKPNMCQVCFEDPVCIILFPCRHACICEECFIKVRQLSSNACPLCRTDIGQWAH